LNSEKCGKRLTTHMAMVSHHRSSTWCTLTRGQEPYRSDEPSSNTRPNIDLRRGNVRSVYSKSDSKSPRQEHELEGIAGKRNAHQLRNCHLDRTVGLRASQGLSGCCIAATIARSKTELVSPGTQQVAQDGCQLLAESKVARRLRTNAREWGFAPSIAGPFLQNLCVARDWGADEEATLAAQPMVSVAHRVFGCPHMRQSYRVCLITC